MPKIEEGRRCKGVNICTVVIIICFLLIDIVHNNQPVWYVHEILQAVNLSIVK